MNINTVYRYFYLITLLGLFACGGSGGGNNDTNIDNTPTPIPPVVIIGSGGGSNSGDLYILDDETGEVLGMLDTEASCNGNPCEIGSIRGAAYDPESSSLIVALGGQGNLCTGCIAQIDLNTGIATVLWDHNNLQAAVGNLFRVDAVSGMAMYQDGTIYAIVKEGEGGTVGLVSFTTTTAPVFIGETGVAAQAGTSYDLGNAIAFGLDGNLYYTTGAGLSTINRSTAAASFIGGLQLSGFTNMTEDADFSRINSLIMLPSGSFAGVYRDEANGVYFGNLDIDTRTFATTAFYSGDRVGNRYTITNFGGLAAVPESVILDKMLHQTCLHCKTFLTTGTFTGDLVTEEGNSLANGVLAADALCMADANYPGSGTYKAMLVDGVNRVASVTSNQGDGQVDWVFHPNTHYYRRDGSNLIMTTNENGIYTDWPLSNSFLSAVVNTTYMTGLSSTWLTMGTYSEITADCNGWTSVTGNRWLGRGDSTFVDALTTQSISYGFNGCGSVTEHLVCIEQ